SLSRVSMNHGNNATAMPSTAEAGWRHERLELTLQQSRERQTGEIAVLRADDLHADRQLRRREAARRRGGRQVDGAGIARPEEVIGDRHTLTVHGNRARVALAVVILRH